MDPKRRRTLIKAVITVALVVGVAAIFVTPRVGIYVFFAALLITLLGNVLLRRV